MMCKGSNLRQHVMEKGQPMEVEHEEMEDRQHLGLAQTDGC